MKPFTVTYYRQDARQHTIGFYIHNKGDDAGRPSLSPTATCYVLHCSAADEHTYFATVEQLWQLQLFKSYCKGIPIAFITTGNSPASFKVRSHGISTTHTFQIIYSPINIQLCVTKTMSKDRTCTSALPIM